MVFKAVSGANQVAFEAYKPSETFAENEMAALVEACRVNINGVQFCKEVWNCCSAESGKS